MNYSSNDAANVVNPSLSEIGDTEHNAGIPTRTDKRNHSSVTLDLSFEELERSGFLTPKSRQSLLAEELRIIKRRLLINADGPGVRPNTDGNLIMVTSTAPGEGKTFVSTNLAMSVAMEIDRTVLLVDCDTVRFGVTGLFGVEGKLGLADLLLRADLDLADVLVKTNIDGLTILPAGKRVSNINELMASQRMARLLKDMASRYDNRIIILDSTPVLATTETSVLARFVGQIVIVTAAGKTKQRDLLTAIARLDPSKEIGLVLNQSLDQGDTPYYDGYYSKL